MHAVWEPDAQTVYLSGARDNLALHEHSEETDPPADARRSLDHLGFIVASPAHVYAAAEAIRAHGITIVQEPREHRDGSHSFYLVDPDNNVIQVLYEPNISPLA
jgi:catechol 2,3-dioxygenase-like lactoylglutathione lyase family enzyme